MKKTHVLLSRLCAAALALAVGTALAILPIQQPQSAQAACSVSACLNIPTGKQQVAQELMALYPSALTANGYPSLITQEIAPIASGTVSAQCDVDIRVLQVLLILVKNFGSVNVTDMNRHCANDPEATCAASPSSPHCAPLPAAALDIDRLGGASPSAAMSQSMLNFISTFVPNGTMAETNCESGAYPNIIRFSATDCSHQHIDFRNTSAPLDINTIGGSTLHHIYVGGGSWINGNTGVNLNGASSVSAVYMGGTWPQVMSNVNGYLYQTYGDSNGWHTGNTGLNIGVNSPISAVNIGNVTASWPRVYINKGGYIHEAYGDSNGWHIGNTGIYIGAGSPISAVHMWGNWAQILANVNGYVHQIYGDSNGWHIGNTGVNIGAGASLSAVKVGGYTTPMIVANKNSQLHLVYATSNGWVLGNTGVNIGSGVPSAQYMGGSYPTITVNKGGVLHQVWAANDTTWTISSSGLSVGSGQLSTVKIGTTIQAVNLE